jgi:hypothetical protein
MHHMPKGVKGFVKGVTRPAGSGRKPGTTNKITRDTKQVMQLLAQNLTPELEEWIRATAKHDKGRAVSLTLTALEFTQPKLQRTEMTGLDGSALSVELSQKDSKL